MTPLTAEQISLKIKKKKENIEDMRKIDKTVQQSEI